MPQPAVARSPHSIAVDEVILEMRPRLESLCAANTTLALHLQAQDVVAAIDSQQLECIVLNLVSNAAESIPDGGLVCIKTSVVVVAKKRHARVGCSDNGGGVAMHSLTRVGASPSSQEGGSMRCVVLDPLGDWNTTEVAGRRGTVLGKFRSDESARAMVLQRLACGDRGVVALDASSGKVVYPDADAA